MKFSKLITVFAGALVVTTLLVACGTKKESNADNTKQSQTTKSEPKKISVFAVLIDLSIVQHSVVVNSSQRRAAKER